MSIWKVPVKINFQQPENLGINVWHVRTETSDQGLGSELRDALGGLVDFYEACASVYSAYSTITIGESMIGDPYGSPFYADDDVTVVNGGGQGDHAPALLAIVASWRTSSATRSGRGRTFVGPLTLAALQPDGTPGTAAVAAVQSAASGLVAASTGANGWAIGIHSTTQNLTRDITGFTVRDRFAYLSSRRA